MSLPKYNFTTKIINYPPHSAKFVTLSRNTNLVQLPSLSLRTFGPATYLWTH